MPGKVNIDGSYDGTIIGGGYKTSGEWLNLRTGWQKHDGVWSRILPTFSGSVGQKVPAGGIVMYYSTGTIPDGWTEYADSDVLLKGWDGNAGTIEATGGSKSFSLTIADVAAHTGTSFNAPYHVSAVNNAYITNTRYAAGAHGHTGTGTGTNPEMMRGILIQADSEEDKLPANAVVFGETFSSLTEVTTSGTYVNGYHNSGTVGGEITSAAKTLSITTDTVGNHRHSTNGYPYEYAQSGYFYANAGSHSHAFNITDLSWDLQRKYVKAFTNVLADFPAYSGSIIGWASSTAPDGWEFCDGQDGRIDLRDYFICCDSNETFGSTDGDNTVDYTYTTPAGGSHRHRGSSYYPPYLLARAGVYHSDYITHSHTGSGDISKEYPYLQLAFIQAQ